MCRMTKGPRFQHWRAGSFMVDDPPREILRSDFDELKENYPGRFEKVVDEKTKQTIHLKEPLGVKDKPGKAAASPADKAVKGSSNK
jgi:hypothetical protein